MSDETPRDTVTAPRKLLADLDALRLHTRNRRWAGSWGPLAIFGLALIFAGRVGRLPSRTRVVVVDIGGTRTAKDQWLSNIAGSPPHWPLSLYWLVAIPTAFALSALWLRRNALRDGVSQPWLPLCIVGLLPFLALVTLRLLIEPNVAAVHAVLQHESPSKYLDPLTSIWLGLLALAVTQRSRAMLTLCATIVAANVALFVLGANGVRSGSWRDRLLSGVGRVFGAIGSDPLTLSGLLLLAAAAYIAIHGTRARERS